MASGGRRGDEGSRCPQEHGDPCSTFPDPSPVPVGIPARTCGVTRAASVPRLLRTPFLGAGQSLPGSPHPRAFRAPMYPCEGSGQCPGLALPTTGTGSGQADRAESQRRRHPAISQHTPAWDMVVSVLLLQKGSFLALRDTNVLMFFVPPHPLAPAALWHWGSGGRRCSAPQ